MSGSTLQVTRGCGRTLGLALLIIALLWGGFEAGMRALVALKVIEPPGLGSLNAELDVKLPLLDRFVASQGPLDCLFFGSSQFDSAVDPEVFTRVYFDLTGQRISCFNFSLGTLTGEPAGTLARVLIERYHPRLLVFGTSARDYSKDFGELTRPLLNNAWIRAQLGHTNLEGWLIEHSMTYRLALVTRGLTNWEYETFFKRLGRQLTGNGFLALDGNNLRNEDDNFIPEYVRSSDDMRGLEELLALNSVKTEVVVVEVPVHVSFLDHYVQASPADYRRLFQQPVFKVVEEHGIPFWLAQEEMQSRIPDSGWADVKHLNRAGAAIYSAWLAEQIQQAGTRGIVHLPVH